MTGLLLVAASGLAREVAGRRRVHAPPRRPVGIVDDDPAHLGPRSTASPRSSGRARPGRRRVDQRRRSSSAPARAASRRRSSTRLDALGHRARPLRHGRPPAASTLPDGLLRRRRHRSLLAGVVLTADVAVGRHVVRRCRTSRSPTTDVVDDFATLCAGVSASAATCRVGEAAYLGMNASVREGVHVGADATLGMGSAVLADVPDGRDLGGRPARPLDPACSDGPRGTIGGDHEVPLVDLASQHAEIADEVRGRPRRRASPRPRSSAARPWRTSRSEYADFVGRRRTASASPTAPTPSSSPCARRASRPGGEVDHPGQHLHRHGRGGLADRRGAGARRRRRRAPADRPGRGGRGDHAADPGRSSRCTCSARSHRSSGSRAVCAAAGVPLVEDAAQSQGARRARPRGRRPRARRRHQLLPGQEPRRRRRRRRRDDRRREHRPHGSPFWRRPTPNRPLFASWKAWERFTIPWMWSTSNAISIKWTTRSLRPYRSPPRRNTT